MKPAVRRCGAIVSTGTLFSPLQRHQKNMFGSEVHDAAHARITVLCSTT
jgi:hypothetical protein